MMKIPWYTHLIIERVLKLNFKSIAKSPLRIGAGKAVNPFSPVDLPVLTIRFGDDLVPYIPGSSLKGVFRSTSEYIGKTVGLKDICMLGEGCRLKYDEMLQHFMKEGTAEQQIIETLSKYCLICKMYGSGTFSSHIEFSDMYPIMETVSRSIKTGIAIDRKSGAAKRGALYQVEFLNPGSTFTGSITMKNLPNYAVGLISLVLDQINSGFVRVGGFKSRGFGEISLEPTGVSGYIMRDGSIIEFKPGVQVTLDPLDEYDTAVTFDPAEPLKLLESCKKAWVNFIQKVVKK